MICILSLFVFAVLGLFSARYRKLAGEAFECVFKRIQLQPCESGLDQKVKSKVIARVFKRNKKAASILNKYFEVFSWALVVLLFLSLVFTVHGLYNYYAYGNCNGPNADPGSCPLPNSGQQQSLEVEPITFSQLDYMDNPVLGARDANVAIVEFGCFECPHTYAIQSQLDRLMQEYKGQVKLVFMHFPLSEHHNSQLLAQTAICAQKQDKFWQYKDKLFAIKGSCSIDGGNDVHQKALDYARDTGLDMEQFKSCLNGKSAQAAKKEVLNDKKQGLGLGVSQTPTLFINGKKIEGYRDYQTLRNLVESELNESN